MIASCPRCRSRYRLDAARIGGGVRLRCRRCDTVFRVRPPAGTAPSPSDTQTGSGVELSESGGQAPRVGGRPAPSGGESTSAPATLGPSPEAPADSSPAPARSALPADAPKVVVALRDPDLAKRASEELESVGLAPCVASDGREALLKLVREAPRALVVEDRLDLLDGRDLCEVVKRLPGLSEVAVVRVRSETAGPVWEVGPDAWIEIEDLPRGLPGLLDLERPAGAPAARSPGPGGRAAGGAPPASAGGAPADDPARAEARRLARIAVSEFALYHPDRFEAAAREGRLVEEFAAELEEGRAHLRGRLGAEVFREGDPLVEELLRQGRDRAGTPA